MRVKQNLGGNSRAEQSKVAAKWRSRLSFISSDGGSESIKTVIALASAVLGEVLEILSQWCKEKCASSQCYVQLRIFRKLAEAIHTADWFCIL